MVNKFFTFVCSGLVMMTINAFSYSELMSSISSLTFHSGLLTTGRRSTGVPQLECTGYCPRDIVSKISTIHCVAIGSFGGDPEWSCSAVLPSGVELGQVQVSCEGYDYPEDPYVLAGSCGLIYQLIQVPVRQEVVYQPPYVHGLTKRR